MAWSLGAFSVVSCCLLVLPAEGLNVGGYKRSEQHVEDSQSLSVKNFSGSSLLASSSGLSSARPPPPADPAFLLKKMATECQCAYLGACTCEASIAFMDCIANACRSGTCDCEGHNAFQSGCGDMSQQCPSVGLTCTILASGTEGKAMCRGADGQSKSVTQGPPPKKSAKIAAPAVPPVPNISITAPEVFPVPTTSRCIVIIVCQYMIVFTALALCRTYHELSDTATGKTERALRAAAQTVTYGPMLCVLFIACRMRVEFLSDGKDQPQMWVQNCMYGTTFAVLATSLVVLLIPLGTGQPLALKEGTCELEKPVGGGALLYGLSALRYVIQLGLYGGIAGVIVGINTYTPPGESDIAKLPRPAPAVMCTMILAVIFFSTQLVVAAARSYTEFTGVETMQLVNVFNTAADTVSFAPMLAILYIAARMRALQHDGQPQEWAQNCMYASTVALAATTVLAIAVPLCIGGETHVDPVTRQMNFSVSSSSYKFVKLFVIVRYLTIAGMYGGAIGVIASIFYFESPAGPERTLPVSPTVQCVVNLCVQYFCIFLALNVMNTIKEVGMAGSSEEPTLNVTMIQATGLKHLNFSGDNMKCHVAVKHSSWTEKASQFVTRTVPMLDPVWNETCELMWVPGESIEFTVQDEGKLGSKTEGRVIVPSEQFYPHGFAGDLPISDMPHAKLHISILPTTQREGLLSRLSAAVDAARATVTFAPMLSILFVTTRMYALLLTNKKGAPQAWVQDGMYMATWSLMISFAVCLATAAATGKVQLDEDGNVVNKFKNKYVGIAVNLVRYLAMILLYGGIVTVIVGLFVMTPETANGRGSLPLVSESVNQTPLGRPPPGLNTVTLPPFM